MPQTATLLLLFAGEPTRAERALIDAHAQKRNSAYIAPAPTPASVYPTYTAARVLALEARLDEARTLSSSLDEKQALEVLTLVERELYEHPEIPQAAFLLAERHRLAASILRAQPGAEAEAAALDARAFVLEGRRAAAFGQTALPDPASAAPSTPIHLGELDARDELEIDGVSGGAERALSPGEHHVRVLRGESLLFASFITNDAAASLRLTLPAVVPCSAWDLAAANPGSNAASTVSAPAARVRCGRWVAVRRVLGKLELAECEHARCGTFTPLEPPPRTERSRFPAWAGVAIAGAASIGVTSLALWAAGAFDRPVAPARTDFVYRGP